MVQKLSSKLKFKFDLEVLLRAKKSKKSGGGKVHGREGYCPPCTHLEINSAVYSKFIPRNVFPADSRGHESHKIQNIKIHGSH